MSDPHLSGNDFNPIEYDHVDESTSLIHERKTTAASGDEKKVDRAVSDAVFTKGASQTESGKARIKSAVKKEILTTLRTIIEEAVPFFREIQNFLQLRKDEKFFEKNFPGNLSRKEDQAEMVFVDLLLPSGPTDFHHIEKLLGPFERLITRKTKEGDRTYESLAVVVNFAREKYIKALKKHSVLEKLEKGDGISAEDLKEVLLDHVKLGLALKEKSSGVTKDEIRYHKEFIKRVEEVEADSSNIIFTEVGRTELIEHLKEYKDVFEESKDTIKELYETEINQKKEQVKYALLSERLSQTTEEDSKLDQLWFLLGSEGEIITPDGISHEAILIPRPQNLALDLFKTAYSGGKSKLSLEEQKVFNVKIDVIEELFVSNPKEAEEALKDTTKKLDIALFRNKSEWNPEEVSAEELKEQCKNFEDEIERFSEKLSPNERAGLLKTITNDIKAKIESYDPVTKKDYEKAIEPLTNALSKTELVSLIKDTAAKETQRFGELKKSLDRFDDDSFFNSLKSQSKEKKHKKEVNRFIEGFRRDLQTAVESGRVTVDKLQKIADEIDESNTEDKILEAVALMENREFEEHLSRLSRLALEKPRMAEIIEKRTAQKKRVESTSALSVLQELKNIDDPSQGYISTLAQIVSKAKDINNTIVVSVASYELNNLHKITERYYGIPKAVSEIRQAVNDFKSGKNVDPEVTAKFEKLIYDKKIDDRPFREVAAEVIPYLERERLGRIRVLLNRLEEAPQNEKIKLQLADEVVRGKVALKEIQRQKIELKEEIDSYLKLKINEAEGKVGEKIDYSLFVEDDIFDDNRSANDNFGESLIGNWMYDFNNALESRSLEEYRNVMNGIDQTIYTARDPDKARGFGLFFDKLYGLLRKPPPK